MWSVFILKLKWASSNAHESAFIYSTAQLFRCLLKGGAFESIQFSDHVKNPFNKMSCKELLKSNVELRALFK